jgi:VRR-NUC domain
MPRPEQSIHKAVVAHLATRPVHGLVWWHTPNSLPTSRLQGAIHKGLGMRAGVSDLILLHNQRFYALELKAPGKKPTADQHRFLQDVTQAGGMSAWVDSADAAILRLESWGLLRGSMQTVRERAIG